jgi:hypothetical protein
MTTLEEAQEWLRSRVDDGAPCPCCSQFAKVYRRKLTSATARALVLMYREAGDGWVYFPDLLGRKQADEAKARYWGLIEERRAQRDDGSQRNGWWRLTPWGVRFVRGQATIAKYARIYDGRCLGLDYSEGTVNIREALGTRFSYDDLMAGV